MNIESKEFEIDRPHSAGNLYNFLIDYKFNRILQILQFSIKGLSVLDVCCGSGMISEYYAESGAKVSGVDLSEEAIENANIRKKRYKFEAEFRNGDVNKLPFIDSSFDVVSVHDGLHHLKKPKEAVLEMARVSKKTVVIIEPARAMGTKVSILLGISKEYEESDLVYRFTKKELECWLKEGGIKEIISKRYIMYYPHKPGITFKILGLPVIFIFVKVAFYIINALFGKFGNKIQVIGVK